MERTGASAAITTWLAGVAAMAVVGAARGSPLQPPQVEPGAVGPLHAAIRATIGWRVPEDDPVAVVAAIAAIVLALTGFLLVLRAARQERMSSRAVIVLTAIGCLVVLAIPLLYSRDVYSYALYGRISSVHDLNPYLVAPSGVADDPFFPLVGAQWRETTSVYGPVFTALSVGITRAISSATGVVWAFRLVAAGSVFATCLLIRRTAGRVLPERAAFAVALFGLNPAVMFQTAASGHNDALVALAVAGALALVVSGRMFAVTLVLTLGTLVKSTCGVALLLWLVIVFARRRGQGGGAASRKALAAHLGLVIGVALLSAVPFLGGGDPTLGQTQLVDHEGWLAPARAVRVIAEGLGDAVSPTAGDALSAAVRAVFALALLAALAGIAVVAGRSAGNGAAGIEPADVRAVGAAWGWGFLALMLLGPVLLPWYVAWGLPIAWTLPRIPLTTTIALSILLMLSLFAADAVTFPDGFQLSARWANYVLAPIVLVLAIAPVRDLIARLRGRAGLTEELATGG